MLPPARLPPLVPLPPPRLPTLPLSDAGRSLSPLSSESRIKSCRLNAWFNSLRFPTSFSRARSRLEVLVSTSQREKNRLVRRVLRLNVWLRITQHLCNQACRNSVARFSLSFSPVRRSPRATTNFHFRKDRKRERCCFSRQTPRSVTKKVEHLASSACRNWRIVCLRRRQGGACCTIIDGSAGREDQSQSTDL